MLRFLQIKLVILGSLIQINKLFLAIYTAYQKLKNILYISHSLLYLVYFHNWFAKVDRITKENWAVLTYKKKKIIALFQKVGLVNSTYLNNISQKFKYY